jgi:2-C-methyl-D-erythritol 4-phosphate cytidylyltransferase
LESVRNGLMSVPDGEEALVAVHDAARPLVSPSLIARGWEAAGKYKAAVPVTPMTDSIRRIEGTVSVAVPRKDYVKVQTPQVFDATLLKAAYDKTLTPDMTDDASVAEAAGSSIYLFEGSPYNMKVTDPLDLAIAATLLDNI